MVRLARVVCSCLLVGIVQLGDPATSTAADPLGQVDFEALRLAIRDLSKTFPEQYTRGDEFLRRADAYESRLPQIRKGLARGSRTGGDEAALREAEEILAFQRDVLLSNPLLSFDKLLLIKRKTMGDPRRAQEPGRGIGKFIGLPQQSSWQIHTMKPYPWENEIAVLKLPRPGSQGKPGSPGKSGLPGKLSTLFKPPVPKLVTQMDLHFDADRIMFSMRDDENLWQVFEIDSTGKNLRQISRGDQPRVHNFDSCYLPNGKIAFVSTATFQGVPCNASVNVGMIYLMDAGGGNVRQLCFEQDHNFCPTVMNDGRILYLRWEYTDIPHVWARFLFTMNPDGTRQREYYGSGSYWPNAIFYARPIPGHPTKIVGTVTGHHVGRIGETVIFDPARGRKSTEGVVQRIPGRGRKVEPLIQDKLTQYTWPKTVHPYPLSEKYFLVAAKPRPDDLWGIYLVDVFDNFLLLAEVEGCALVEPIPFLKTTKPPVIPERVDLKTKDALVYLEDVYQGPGLAGVPRGSVKRLRLFTYHFAYQRIAGISHRVGADGPWEPKRVLGTVPVEADGSASFRVPANMPISIQPLDAQGKALQLMRSWMTAMPGEIVSCVGCHEKQNSTPPSRSTIAAVRPPSEIEPWYGPVRGFSFKREVQPVLDKYCVSCHDGSTRRDGKTLADLRADQGKFIVYRNSVPQGDVIGGVSQEELFKRYGGVFEPSYIELRKYIRVGGLESDLRLLDPCEFNADTAELIQMLNKGHYGVELDREAWERLVTWIDLNAPCHGTWRETVGVAKTQRDHGPRKELRRLYAGIDEDPEVVPEMPRRVIRPVKPKPMPEVKVEVPKVAGWPFDAAEARRRQVAAGTSRRVIDLDDGVQLEMVLIPPGEFPMGAAGGLADERPLVSVKIADPFWIGRFEVTNEQFARFDPSHDSRFEHRTSWIFANVGLGWMLNHPRQPVVRVSQQEAAAFCRWLSAKIGQEVTLPTEAQWEYACRAGSAGAMFYGDLDADFSQFANVSDATMRELVYDARNQYSPDLVPRDARFSDNRLVTAQVGNYRPNAWGLHDVHGNVWEWTRSAYRPYPYRDDDGRNGPGAVERIVVRGGSWYDRPQRCRSAFRLSYPAWQPVFNVGFRVVCEASRQAEKVALTEGPK